MPSTAFEHGEFYAPEIEIIINGTAVDRNRLYVTELEVDLSCEAASLFSMRVANAISDTLELTAEWPFRMGARITLRAGYRSEFETLLEGVITAVTLRYGEEEHLSIDVEGYDLLFLLMKQYHQRSFTDMSDSDVAGQVLSAGGLKNEIDRTDITYHHIRQDHESDFAFLSRLAQRNGFDLYTREDTVRFKAPAVGESVARTFTYGLDPVTFSCRHDISAQVEQVSAYGWDPLNRTEVSAESSAGDIASVAPEKEEGSHFLGRAGINEITYPDVGNYENNAEAQRAAEARMHRFAYSLVGGKGSVPGVPSLRPGEVIEMAGFSEAVNGRYYLTRVIHRIGRDEGYTTYFEVKGNRCDESL